MHYDDKYGYWKHDDDGTVTEKMKDTVLHLYDAAQSAFAAAVSEAKAQAAAGNPPGKDAIAQAIKKAEALVNWAKQSQMRNRIEAAIQLASTSPSILRKPSDFNVDPYLLNVNNGTIDLRTGKLRPHSKDDWITMLAPVDYDPDATDPILDRFITEKTQGNQELADYLQQAAGSTLIGESDARKVFFLLGPPGAGKSTFLEAMHSLLGTYAARVAFDTLLERDKSQVGRPRPDLVVLQGKRFVAAVEPNPSGRLDAAAIKELTGGDTITVRGLYQAPISFKPVFKIWLAANKPPRIPDDDPGLWARLVKVPFDAGLPEDKQDKAIKAHLRDDPGGRRALLAWAVKGAMAYIANGGHIATPSLIAKATADLRASFDPLADFLADCCVLDPFATVTAGDLRRVYEQWCQNSGRARISDANWTARLEALGCIRKRVRKEGAPTKIWEGIGLLDTGGHMA
jgi:putative DNA primase/helicase